MRISDGSSDVCSSDLLIAAMGADIVERLNSVIAAARHHDRRVPELDGLGDEAALFGKLFNPTHGQPSALEQIFAFSLEIGGRSIRLARNWLSATAGGSGQIAGASMGPQVGKAS